MCGGNDAAHLRTMFIEYCDKHQKDLQIFLPEYAMSSVLKSDVDEQFDLAEFEETVADLSHSVVIFPEAPGSWAETGYFSAVERVARSCILALNSKHQSDSFILLGPALKIERSTIFRPNIQLDYSSPSFDGIIAKIKSRNFSDVKKKLVIDDVSKLSAYELCGLICGIVDLLTCATINDILYFFTVITGNRFKKNRIRYYTSILVGAKFLKVFGDYDHMYINRDKSMMVYTVDGYRSQESLLKIELVDMYESEFEEFSRIVKGALNVD